jgi:hypothetical protein
MKSLRKWQREFYAKVRNNKYSLVMGSRGCGKDSIILLIILELLESGEDVAILNKSERLNKIFIRKLGRLSKELRVPSEGNVLELRHRKSGAVCVALSGRLDNLQGIHSTIVVNELGGIEGDAEEVIAYAYGSVGSRPESRLIIATNSTEPNTWLHHFFESNEPRFEEYRNVFAWMNVTVWDVYATEEELPPALAAQKRTLSKELWQRWYENKFTSVESPMVSDEILEELLPAPPLGLTHTRIAAVDIGTSNDPTALVVLGRKDNRWFVVGQERVWGMPLAEQPLWLDQLAKKYRWSKCVIDSGGIGLSVWQALENRTWSIKGHCNKHFYQKWTPTLQQKLSDGEIHITPYSPVWKELSAAKVDPDGVLQKAYATEGGKRTHCDYVDALLMATSNLPHQTKPVQATAGGKGLRSGRPVKGVRLAM